MASVGNAVIIATFSSLNYLMLALVLRDTDTARITNAQKLVDSQLTLPARVQTGI